MQITRRRTLQLGAATLAAQTLPGCKTVPTDLKSGGYIDAHAHVWSDDLEKYPLGPWATKADMKPTTFTDDQLLAVIQPHGLDRCVLIQHAPLHGYDNSYIIDCAQKRPGTFSVVAMINERTPNLKQRLQGLHDQGARGIRIGPTKHADRTLNVDPPNWLNSPGQQLLWKYAAELDVAICPLLGPRFLPSLAPMCAQHPDTTVVIDHFGHIDVDKPDTVAALTQLARHRSVHVKLSGFYKFGDREAPYSDLAPMIGRVVDAFGPSRLMWASDLPYQLKDNNTYHDAIQLVKDQLVFLSSDERESILCGTAERVFF